MAIRWVFFDIGDVLFDENAPHYYWFHSLLLAMRRNGVDASWDEYHARLQILARQKPDAAIVDAARQYVTDPELWDKIFREARAEYHAMRKPRPYGVLLDDITAVVQTLSEEFKLGIIANQHPPVVQALDDYGIGRHFDVVAINEALGISKPDHAIFHWALNEAKCEPPESIMIGDRPDNDIAPAKTIGMATIRFRRGVFYALYDPLTPAEHADIVVRETTRLVPAVRQIARSARDRAASGRQK